MAPVMPTPTCDRKRRRYSKVRQIGHGTFGVVHLVSDRLTGETLVMKEVSLKGLPPKEQRASKNEVRVLQALKHPNIVAYKDSFVSKDGCLCLVMEYCERGDMYDPV